MGKKVEIDSEVLAEILRTHSPACCLVAAGIIAAAGCDEKGRPVPLTVGEIQVVIDHTKSTTWPIRKVCDGESLGDREWVLATPAELARLRKELGVSKPEKTCMTCGDADDCHVSKTVTCRRCGYLH